MRRTVFVVFVVLALSIGVAAASAGDTPNPQRVRSVANKALRLSSEADQLEQMMAEAGNRADELMDRAWMEASMGVILGKTKVLGAWGASFVVSVTALDLPELVDPATLAGLLEQLQQKEAELLEAKTSIVGELDAAEVESLRGAVLTTLPVVQEIHREMILHLLALRDSICPRPSCLGD